MASNFFILLGFTFILIITADFIPLLNTKKFNCNYMNLIVIIVIALVLIAILVFIPSLQIKSIKEINSTLETKIQLKDLENKFRLTVAQIIGGMIILFGAYATIKSIEENKKKRLRDNFNEAISNLSSTDSLNNLKKVASIYIIESVSKELPDEYYKTSMEIYTHYLDMTIKRKYSKDSITSPVINSIFDVLGNQNHIKFTSKEYFLYFHRLNLMGLEMINGDLRKVYFEHINFAKASVEKCDFSGSYFLNTDFTNANIQKSTFINSTFQGCTFTYSNLLENNFRTTIFNECDFRKIKLKWNEKESKTMISLNFLRFRFFKCICDSISLNDGNFNNSSIVYSKFLGTSFKKSQFQNSRIYNNDFRFANFKNANFENTDLRSCDFSGSDLTGSNIEKAKFLKSVNLKNVIGLTNTQKIICKRLQAIIN